MKKLVIFVMFVWLVGLVEPVKSNPYQKEYEEMLYPVVRITTTDGTGSGVIIATTDFTDDTDNTYILTACHVVGNKNAANVELYDSTVITASVVITDTVKDLALLTTDSTDFTDKYKAKLAPRDYVPYLFAPVWAVGCSLGLNPRPSFGHLCVLCDSVANYWEISAPILPGNSGGPVYSAETREVIGIVVWVRTYQGQLITTMAGVVPINEIHEFLTAETQSSQRK